MKEPLKKNSKDISGLVWPNYRYDRKIITYSSSDFVTIAYRTSTFVRIKRSGKYYLVGYQSFNEIYSIKKDKIHEECINEQVMKEIAREVYKMQLFHKIDPDNLYHFQFEDENQQEEEDRIKELFILGY